MYYDEEIDYFTSFGNKHKLHNRKSPGGRPYHGRNGWGRYKILRLGSFIEWESSYRGEDNIKIVLDSIDLNTVKINKIENPKSEDHYTKIRVYNIDKNFSNQLQDDKLLKDLGQYFCIYLYSYPEINISLNDIKIDYRNNILNIDESKFEQIIKNKTYTFTIKIVETNVKSEQNIFLCNQDGMVLFPLSSKYNPKSVNVICYILSNYFQELESNNILDTDFNEKNNLIERATDIVKKYVRRQKADIAKDFIKELKEQDVYPYEKEPINETEEIERDVFDVILYETNEVSNFLNKQTKESKKLILNLVKETYSFRPTRFLKLLKEIFALKEEDLAKLLDLIEEVSFENIINLSSIINERIKILDAFNLILFDEEYSKRVKERSQFHKLLVNNLWIFGDQYTYGVDDKNLHNLLKKHLDILGRKTNELKDTVIKKLSDIPDIFIYRQFINSFSPDNYLNLIIEIKKPGKKASYKEYYQIVKYATTISNEPMFDKNKTKWIFILLVNEYDESIETTVHQENREPGVAVIKQNLEIRVHKWSEITQSCDGRLRFLKDKFETVYEKTDIINFLKSKYNFLTNL